MKNSEKYKKIEASNSEHIKIYETQGKGIYFWVWIQVFYQFSSSSHCVSSIFTHYQFFLLCSRIFGVLYLLSCIFWQFFIYFHTSFIVVLLFSISFICIHVFLRFLHIFMYILLFFICLHTFFIFLLISLMYFTISLINSNVIFAFFIYLLIFSWIFHCF